MKKILLGIAVLLILNFVFAEKAIELPELYNPRNIIVNGEQILISDYPQVYIYSMANYNLI